MTYHCNTFLQLKMLGFGPSLRSLRKRSFAQPEKRPSSRPVFLTLALSIYDQAHEYTTYAEYRSDFWFGVDLATTWP
jgi:hypothetical protein